MIILARMVAHDQNPLGFISFSRGRHKRFEDQPWLERVQTAFTPLKRRGKLTLWDDSQIDHGDEWYGRIREAMEKARVAVLLVSPDYIASDFCMKEEFPYLVERAEAGGLILLPILVRDCDWEEERWLEAHQMRPAEARPLLELGPAEVDKELKAIVRDVTARLDTMKERKPVTTSWPLDRCDITRLPASGRELFGRKEELTWLDACWRTPTTNVVSLIAWGGVGKSALVNRWLEGMAKKDWDGADRIFGWSFYSQGSHENSAASADLFIDTALRWLGDPDPAAGSPWDKGERLADLVRKQRTLLVLDGLEPLQWASGDSGRIKDPALATLVETLADGNPGLVLITSRMHVTGLEDFDKAAVPERDLHRLTKEAGRALLRVRGARGWDHELEAMSEAFGNHAFAVSLLASWLRTEDTPHPPKVEAIPGLPSDREDERPVRRVLAAFAARFGEGQERQVLRLLGLFDRPATKGELDALLQAAPIPALTDRLGDDAVRSLTLQTLRKTGLLAPESSHAASSLDAHPLVRAHFQDELRDQHPEAWREGNGRIYRHLIRRPEKDQPDNLTEMQPLLLAISHGCAAGHHHEVFGEIYWRRMLRERKHYTTRKLGACSADLAVLTAFFDSPWQRPLATFSAGVRAFLLNTAAHRLRALGRPSDAVEPMRIGLELRIKMEVWKDAALNAGNLSELLVTLGSLKEAKKAARQAIDFAERGDIAFLPMARMVMMHVCHQCGQVDEDEAVFVNAEDMGGQWQPFYPRLYSLQGFMYCDLLLDRGRFAEVRDWASRARSITKRSDCPLDTAFDLLSLGRAHAAEVVASGGDPATAGRYLDDAVAGLHRAGQQDDLPRGLLVRAAFRRQMGKFATALQDLSEVKRIARRGGMRLHLIDHDLEAARLFLAKGKPDAAFPMAEQARTAINEAGYHRRDPEVRDLEQQLGISPLEPQQPSPTSLA